MHEDRPPVVRRGRRAAGRAGRRRSCATRRAAAGAPRPHSAGSGSGLVEAHRVAAQFYAEQLAESPRRRPAGSSSTERGFDQAAAAALRRRLRAPLAGTPCRGTCAAGASPTRSWSPPGWSAQGQRGPVRPVPRPAGLADPRPLRRRRRLRRAPAASTTTGSRPSTSTPRRPPLYKKSPGALRRRPRQAGHRPPVQAVVVEGYTDVMACHLAGVDDRDRHLRHGVRRRPHPGPAPAADGPGRVPRRGVFTFDGDAAGQKAALRGVRGATSSSSPRRSSRSSRAAWTRASCASTRATTRCASWSRAGCRCSSSRSARRWAGTTSTPPRAGPVASTARPCRWSLGSAIMHFATSTPEALGLGGCSRRARRRTARRALAGAPDRSSVRHRSPTQPPDPGQQALGIPVHGDVSPQTLALERDVLRVAVRRPALAGPAFDDLRTEAFSHPPIGPCAKQWARQGDAPRKEAAALGGRAVAAAPDATRNLVAELSVEPAPADGGCAAALCRVGRCGCTRCGSRAEARDPQGEAPAHRPVGADRRYNRLFGELMAMEKQRRDLRERGLGNGA